MKDYFSRLTNSKVNLFILLAVLGILIIIILDIIDDLFNFHDILVELHGLIYDLFVFGVVLTFYETNRERKTLKEKAEKDKNEKIERYREEINDFRFWKSDEAKFRISGLVKRLINLDEKKLDLSHCFLQQANGITQHKEMQEWDFSAANLNDTLWISNNCVNSTFYHTQLYQSTFRNVNLTDCKFDSAFLFETNFKECNFQNVTLEDVIVHSQDWFQEMKWNKNTGIEVLEQKYELIELQESEQKILSFKIVRK
ncbi:pentapeptide repeat-containing protein [Gramella sp. KN1008]|uniref:pentapeptide repeat-containing protein n=1 Tax=Gramella sp. KN1008 TaxID=2529298 RepID=UPI00103A4A14|nr:pentapeptide repeat-containing protein [Gramella sp. KN1008]TBW25544.1 pentapeptide repeat-containing protein [Gramella sp. KN1008]